MSSFIRPRAMSREGIALPIALAAIVTIGAVITGVFFASTQEFRVGRNTLAAQRAFSGAELGLSEVVSSWTAARTAEAKVGQTVRMSDTTIEGATVKRVYTKVSPTVFWLTATATAGGGSTYGRATKRLNTVLRVANPDFKIMGAATMRGPNAIGGSAKVSGTDTVPANWDCPPSGPAGAGIVVADSSATNPRLLSGGGPSGAGCASYSCLTGDPKIKDSTEMVRDTMNFTKFGGFTYDDLAAGANIKWTAVDGTSITMVRPYINAATNTCDLSNKRNWGAMNRTNPPGKCDDYYPVVHLKDPALTYTITGDGGQGILLVDGNLKISGNFVWTGIVLVRGMLELQGNSGPTATGVKLIGAVMSMNRNGTEGQITGNSSITFSRCVINQITARRAVVGPTKYRAWADMSF